MELSFDFDSFSFSCHIVGSVVIATYAVSCSRGCDSLILGGLEDLSILDTF